jgi:hypothetical protein
MLVMRVGLVDVLVVPVKAVLYVRGDVVPLAVALALMTMTALPALPLQLTTVAPVAIPGP